MAESDSSREASDEASCEPEDVSPVAVGRGDAGGWDLVVQPGSDSSELHEAVTGLPAGLKFIEAHGDVDVTLVYRAPDVLPSRRVCLGVRLPSALAGHDDEGSTRRWMTDGERHAYRAGKADAFDAIARAVLDVAPDAGAPRRRR